VSNVPMPGALPPAMAESLDLLRQGDVLTSFYAFLLEHSGVLDADFPAVETRFAFSEPREERAERILDSYAAASLGASLASSAIRLVIPVPFVGPAIAFGAEMFMLFRIRSRMIFELAAIYGFDIREGLNLALVASTLIGAFHVPEVRIQLAGLAALVVLAEASYLATGAVPIESHVARFFARALMRAISPISRTGARILARYTTLGLAKSQAKQVIGYATFGVSVLGEAALVHYTTLSIGRHGIRTFRPWGGGMLVDGGGALVDPLARECGAKLLAYGIWADGVMGWEERALLAGYLGRRIHSDGAWRPMNSLAEMAEQAELASDSGLRIGDFRSCLEERFLQTDADTRHGLLAGMLAVMSADGEQATEELARYRDVLVLLRGDDWFDGVDGLDDDDVAAVETSIATLFGISQELLDEPLLEHPLGSPELNLLIEGLDSTPSEAHAAIPVF